MIQQSKPQNMMMMWLFRRMILFLLSTILYYVHERNDDSSRSKPFLFLTAEAILAGAIVIPHGDFAYDPTLLPNGTVERERAEKIATASRKAGHWLFHDVQPDILFLSTPHGIKLDTNFGIFMGNHGKGSVLIGDDLYNATDDQMYNLTLEVELAPRLAKSLLANLTTTVTRQNVSGIYSYNDEQAMPLQWGEIIPLSMIFPEQQQQQSEAETETVTKDNRRLRPTGQGRRRQDPTKELPQQKPVLIWSNPERRYDHAPEMVPELLRLGGQYLLSWMEDQPERIGVVISSDLSHTHQPQGPYGYSNASAPFDAAMGTWATNPCSIQGTAALLETGRTLQTQAMACGFTGLVLLHGMLCSSSSSARTHVVMETDMDVVPDSGTMSASSSSSGIQFQSTLLANQNVSYYGMLVSTFARI